MGRSAESVKTSDFLVDLKELGYFKKLSDRYQIGLPDVIGSYRGLFVGMEFKEISVVPEDYMVPPASEHPFTKAQVKELNNIVFDGGAGIAIVICGNIAFWFSPDHITEDGQVNCFRAIENQRVIKRVDGRWDVAPVLEFWYESTGFKRRKDTGI